MSYEWGTRSKEHIAQCDTRLKELAWCLIDVTPFDLTVTDSHRGQGLQDEAFASGASQVQWPNSKHNKFPSRAIHIDPYPINYENSLLYYVLAGVILTVSKNMEMEGLRWGGDWDSDLNLNEETFRDLAHWEVAN